MTKDTVFVFLQVHINQWIKNNGDQTTIELHNATKYPIFGAVEVW